jgi:hypothetical protein
MGIVMESVMTVDWLGRKVWKNSKGDYHREDGPAIECPDGTIGWYINGKLHREYGPACEYVNGEKSWWIDGKRHREDGPAIEDANGSKFWYINGKQLAEQNFNKWRLANKPLTYIDMTVRVKRNFSNNKDLWV